jgi:hypothetical protein
VPAGGVGVGEDNDSCDHTEKKCVFMLDGWYYLYKSPFVSRALEPLMIK